MIDFLRRIKADYFADKNYTQIYLHHFFHNIAHSVMYVFTGAYFLKLGMPLPLVLLFYGLEFGVRGLLCPLGFSFLNKVGLMKGLIVATTSYILFFVGISFAQDNLFIAFGSLLFAAINGSIYHPFMDVLEAIYIKDNHNRTKQLSMGMILGSMGKIIGTAGAGFVLANFGFSYILAAIIVILTLSLLSLAPLRKGFKSIPDITPQKVYGFLGSKDFKPFIRPFFGEQLIIIVWVVMIPVFIFSVVEKIDSLGYIIALSIILEQICTLIAGHFTDRFGTKGTLRFANIAYPMGMLGYIFLAKNPFSLLLLESYQKINNNIYRSTFRSAIHSLIRAKHPDKMPLFGAAWQITLCFGELIVLPIYALLACFIGIKVFYVGCAMAIVGIWMSTRLFTKPQNQET